MTAEILQIRDYQSKRAIERAHKALEQQAVEIFSTAFPSVLGFGDGIDSVYLAPEKDGA